MLELPAKPKNHSLFSYHSQSYAFPIHILTENSTGEKNHHHKNGQIGQALSDYRVRMLSFVVFCHNLSNSLQSNFTGIIYSV